MVMRWSRILLKNSGVDSYNYVLETVCQEFWKPIRTKRSPMVPFTYNKKD